MLGFLRTPDPRSPCAAISHVVEQAGLPADVSRASMLRVVESRGRYSGRKVLFVRVFDPARAAACAVVVQRFGDLDPYPSLVLWSGHVERDGTVAITRSAPAAVAGTPTRAHADRTAHPDDERFVCQGRDAAAPGETS
jgi:hypothetical protein